MKRKIFLQNTARLFFLGAFASGTAYLFKEGRITNSEECGLNAPCSGCRSLSGCNFPKALSHKYHE